MPIDPTTGDYVPPPLLNPNATGGTLGMVQDAVPDLSSLPATPDVPAVPPALDASLAGAPGAFNPALAAPAAPVPVAAVATPVPVAAPAVTAPTAPVAPVAPVAPAVPDKSSTSSGASLSASRSGITDNGIKMEEAANRATNDKLLPSMLADINQRKQEAFDRLDRSAEESNAAQDAVAAATTQFNKNMREVREEQAKLAKKSLDLEQAAQEAAKTETANFMADYQKQLSGIRALMAQDPDPSHHYTLTQSFGVGAAAFAQGFLASRGVNINPMGAIDKWIDQSIQEHRQKIADAKDVLQQGVNLHNLARENAKDEADYRMRLKGMALEAINVTLDTYTDQFKSDLALANAKVRKAELAAALAQNKNQIAEKTGQDVLDQIKNSRAYQIEREKLSIEHEKYALSAREAQARLDAAKAEALNRTYLPDVFGKQRIVVDPNGNRVPADQLKNFVKTKYDGAGLPTVSTELPDGYRYVDVAPQPYMIKKSASKEDQHAAVDHFIKIQEPYIALKVAGDHLREMYKDVPEFANNGKFANQVVRWANQGQTSFLTEPQRRYVAALQDFVQKQVIANSGTRASDEEYKRIADNYSANFTSDGATASVIDDVLGKAQTEMNAKVMVNPNIIKSDPNAGKVAAVMDRGEGTNYEARMSPDASSDPVARQLADKASERGNTTSISAGYDLFTQSLKEQPADFTENAVKAVDSAAKILATNGPNSEIGRTAVAALQSMSTGSIGSHNLDDHTAQYAAFVLDMFKDGKSHQDMYKLFNDHREGEMPSYGADTSGAY